MLTMKDVQAIEVGWQFGFFDIGHRRSLTIRTIDVVIVVANSFAFHYLFNISQNKSSGCIH